jgi:hypothetical protein
MVAGHGCSRQDPRIVGTATDRAAVGLEDPALSPCLYRFLERINDLHDFKREIHYLGLGTVYRKRRKRASTPTAVSGWVGRHDSKASGGPFP